MKWPATIRRRVEREEGVVMVTVLMVTLILLLLAAGSISYAVSSQPLSRRDQDWNAALSAAEAGLDDFLFRLNENDQYYLYSATNLPPDGNTAFTTWTNVPSSGGNAQFRYTTNTSFLASQGAVIVTSTGRSKNAVRTIQATLRRRAFIDYLYFTDYETTDPAAYPNPNNGSSSTWAQTNCAQHYYEGRPSAPPFDNTHCTDISFSSADTINGPLHTNDALLICGSPTFLGNVTSSWQPTSGNRWRANSTCSGNNPSFKPGDPRYADPLTMPPSNLALKSEADATAGGEGCLFTGPTSITLNSDGTMTVASPYTKAGAAANNCVGGTLAAPATQPLPTNGVIYVQNVPTAGDPGGNYTASCITSTELASGSTAGTATVQHPLGYPQKNDITAYGCKAGDAFVKGTLKGRLTIASDNNVEIIGNLAYQGGTGGSDLLGLIANNYVEIYHPVDKGNAAGTQPPAATCDGAAAEYPNNSDQWYCNLRLPGSTTAFRSPTISTALLSVAHSFRAQNYAYGDNTPLGAITLQGAIAQKYRGTVGRVNASGYGKAYSYDQRLKYQSPPKFLNPVAAAWQIATWIEQGAAYTYSAP